MGYSKSGKKSKPDPTEPFPTDLYDVTLCMTNIGKGSNSKYKLQILVPDDKTSGLPVYLWRVWGRVGDDGGGGTKLQEFDNVTSAKKEFCALFKKQTQNKWEDRKNFTKVPGAYYQMDVSYVDDEDENDSSSDKKKDIVSAGDPSSRLPLRVQEIIASIFDVEAANTALRSLNIDVTKMPLGKMTEAQLKDAYSVLTQIDALLGNEKQEEEEEGESKEKEKDVEEEKEEDFIGSCDSAFDVAAALREGQLQQLSNQFYTKCPSTDPEFINTKEILQSKIKMVDELLDLQISASVMDAKSNDKGKKKAPVDEAYEKLKTNIIPLDTEGPEWEMLDQYVNNTRNATAPDVSSWGCNDWEARGLRMIDAFRVERHGESEKFEANKSLGNRKLLWHGSRITNYGGILGQGLRIAPPEAPASGYRFGKGVYFADLLGKSASYCRTDGSAEMLVMACDVALGMPFATPRDMYMEKPQPGTNSTHALAQIIPDPANNLILRESGGDDSTGEVCVPLGKAIANPGVSSMPHTPGCDVNEFIVYDQSQVNIKYLLRLTTNSATEQKKGKGGNPYDPNSIDLQSYAFSEKEEQEENASKKKGKKLSLRLRTGKRKSDDSGDAATTDQKKSKGDSSKKTIPAHRFIESELEDCSAPSASGLKVLNSRTFAEGLRLTVVEDDMMESKTEAIVIPSDSYLSLNGMIGQNLAAKSGNQLTTKIQELRSSGFTLGDSKACVLDDCGLSAVSSVVFVASPVFSMQPSQDVAKINLQDAVKNVLRECAKKSLTTVTLPSIGSGQAGYDKGDAAKWIVAAIAGYLEEASDNSSQQQSLQEVCFCLFDSLSVQAYKEGIQANEGNDADNEENDGLNLRGSQDT